jgi:FtsP/CotA-like multicopper oxidase with cupredoxin domain
MSIGFTSRGSTPKFRRWAAWIAAVFGLLAIAGVGVGAVWWFTSPIDTFDEIAFEQELRIPPIAPSRIDEDGTRAFDITAATGIHEMARGKRVTGWGFNGPYLGPTIRANIGDQVRIDVHNQLDEPTTVHWHGAHLPAEMDGGPHQMVEPGDTWSPGWRIDQNAATLWYHPHPHGETEEHVQHGLAGMLILDDPSDPVQRALPHEYGVDDIPVIVQDKSIEDDQIDVRNERGDTILVNGTYGPYFDVTTERMRLRLLNGSISRVYNFQFDDGRVFDLIGTDGGLLSKPAELESVALSPGERAEIIVALQPGETTTLRSYPPDLSLNPIHAAFVGGRDRFDVLRLRAAETLTRSADVPATLAEPPALGDEGDDVDRKFELGSRTINGQKMDMDRIDETVPADTTEIWEVSNASDDYHNFHIHGVQFQVVEVDGRAPSVELSGWKDTLFMPPARTVHLAMRFSGYTDPDVPYMYHCHLLHHEDRGMMGQFAVVEPQAGAGNPASLHSH